MALLLKIIQFETNKKGYRKPVNQITIQVKNPGYKRSNNCRTQVKSVFMTKRKEFPGIPGNF